MNDVCVCARARVSESAIDRYVRGGVDTVQIINRPQHPRRNNATSKYTYAREGSEDTHTYMVGCGRAWKVEAERRERTYLYVAVRQEDRQSGDGQGRGHGDAERGHRKSYSGQDRQRGADAANDTDGEGRSLHNHLLVDVTLLVHARVEEFRQRVAHQANFEGGRRHGRIHRTVLLAAFKVHSVEGRHAALQGLAPLDALVGDGALGEALAAVFPVLAVALVLVAVARVLEAFVAPFGVVVPGCLERVGRGSVCVCVCVCVCVRERERGREGRNGRLERSEGQRSRRQGVT
jgi:hypothetical protein